MNMKAQSLYLRWQSKLGRFETESRLSEDKPIDVGDSEVVILGMGRIGTEVFNILRDKYGMKILGIDHDKERVQKHILESRNVLHGDVTDVEFWQRIQLTGKMKIAILATSQHSIHKQVLELVDSRGLNLKIAALSRHDDEIEELKIAGVEVVFNLYSEAGSGYAEHIAGIFSKEG